MKRIIIALLLLMITFIAGAQSLDRQIRKLAEEITRGYMEGIEDVLIKPRIGIGEFSEETEGAVKNSVGSLASALLTDEFSRSTVFSVIERKDLEAIMKEYSLSLSGLTSEETAPELGELQGVELLLLGSVSEAGETYIIVARLVEVETGKIVVSSSIRVGRQEIEQESQLYIASTFQSPYGITFSPGAAVLMEVGGNENFFSISSIDVGYRVAKWLALSMGYAHLDSGEMSGLDSKKITVVTNEGSPRSYEVTRYFRFSGDGIKLAATAAVSPTVRLSLGGFYMPEFIPIWFESAGSVRDNTINSDSDIDRNGTFPQYQDFNFSRSTIGDKRIGFSAMGVSVQLGMAVNF